MNFDDGLHSAGYAGEPIGAPAETAQYHDPPFNGIEVSPGESPELHRISGICLQDETGPGFGRAKTAVETHEKTAFEDVKVKPQKRKICGLRPITFSLLAIIIGLLLIGGIGGGVGGAISSKKNSNSDALASEARTLSSPAETAMTVTSSSGKSQLPTSSPSRTSDSIPSALSRVATSSTFTAASPTVIVECPNINETIHKTPTGQEFDIICGVDVRNGPDINTLTEYSVEDCINACGTYNRGSTSSDDLCEAITWNAELKDSLALNGGNCFLKASKGDIVPGLDEAMVASAFRLDGG